VVATIGLAARAQQIPTTPNNLPPQTCEERVRAARLAGLPTTEVCGHAHGGFGATGKGHSSGG
jgi:hypothetical protein